MALTMADFKAYMAENTNKTLEDTNLKLSNLSSSVTEIESAVKGNSRRLDQQADSIKANHESIRKMRMEIDSMKNGGIRPAATTTDAPPTPLRRDPGVEADFLRARKALRLWPIRGRNADELWEAAGIFLGTNLALKGKLDKNSIESITRVSLPSGPGVRDEALVVFVDNAVRDMVMGSAAKLAAYIDDSGKPTAGMRIEVPAHLQRDFRVLFKYGQGLRTRHGVGTRRHVKFDDVDMNLYLNVRLPGDLTWSRVSIEVAKRGLRARQLQTNDDLERRLDFAGEMVDRPRSASTSAASTRTETDSASAWTTRRTESTSS